MAQAKVAHTCVSCFKETQNKYCKKCDILIQAGHEKTCLLFDEHDMSHPFKVFD